MYHITWSNRQKADLQANTNLMKKALILLYTVFFSFISCQKEEKDPFLISKTQVGFLTKDTQIRQLDSLFKNDSLVVQDDKSTFDTGNKILVYDKDGMELLLLSPVQDFDSTSTIGRIQIMDPRFQTKTGLGPASTFKDILANYRISRIESTLNAIVVFIDEINVYVTIEKTELPVALQGAADQHIEAGQIPDDAKINYFWIGWQ